MAAARFAKRERVRLTTRTPTMQDTCRLAKRSVVKLSVNACEDPDGNMVSTEGGGPQPFECTIGRNTL